MRGKIALAVLTFCACQLGALGASAQTIQTVAGGGFYVNSPALQVAVNSPAAVAYAPNGSVYLIEGNRVDRLNPATGLITVVAGNGSYGYSGDGGPATSAALFVPSGVAVDGAGNLYIADTQNNVIRKVSVATGVISTVAGNGVSGYLGDGGPATSAELSEPYGVAVDSAGNLYIADTYNNCIRVVSAKTGLISTVAGNGSGGYSGDGGLATAAELSNPAGLAVDGSGNLYIADTGNELVRMVSAQTGVISTVAGNGSYGYSGDGGPATSAGVYAIGVAVDGAGNLYIADTGDQRIRMVSAATGIISTVAGDGSYGYSGDGGPATGAELSEPYGVAVDGAGNLYVADTGNNRIRAVKATTGFISTVAGNGDYVYLGDGGPATSAELSNPYGVALDGAGNLYIADTPNNLIRMVSAATGVISTVAGNGVDGYSGDGGPATSAELSSPYGLTVDGAGNLYIADTQNNVIRMVSAANGVISTVAGNGGAGYSGDGGPATAAELADPFGVAVDGAGNLYIADTQNNLIRMVNAATGLISTVAGNGSGGYSGDGGPATAAEISNPYGIAVDGAGNLYIADTGNELVRMVNAATGLISTLAGNGSYGYSGDGGPATAAELSDPYSVAVDGAGNLYIADFGNDRIRRVSAATGFVSTVAGDGSYGYSGDGGPATSAELAYPYGVALSSRGNLYLADTGNKVVREVAGLAVSKNPPVITPVVTGTLGTNGWYTGNVQVSWTVSDGTSSIISQSGCGMVTISTDTAGRTLTCSATSQFGGTTKQSVTIKRDATPPTIIITAPMNGATYGSGAVIDAAYSCNDSLSGAASCSGTVAKGAPISTTSSGSQTFTVTATDQAGNVTQKTIGYGVLTSDIVTLGISSGIQTYPAFTNFAIGPSYKGSPVPTGTVTLYDNNSALTTLKLGANGVAYYTANPLNAGVNVMTASYSGDAHYAPGVSAPVTLDVSPAPVHMTGSCRGGTPYKVAYQCVVTVGAATATPPTGNIVYSLDGASMTAVPLSNGTASFTVATLPAGGAHKLTIAYAGQGNYAAGTTLTESFTTAPGQTKLLISPSSYYLAAGSPISLTVTASTPQSGTPPGKVTLYDNGTALGTATIGGNGVATYPIASIRKGTHTYTAAYAATANYAAATSAGATVTAH